MKIEEIMARRSKIETDLRIALSTMEKKETIHKLRQNLVELQNKCPHFSLEHSYAIIDEKCPYCGAKIFMEEQQ